MSSEGTASGSRKRSSRQIEDRLIDDTNTRKKTRQEDCGSNGDMGPSPMEEVLTQKVKELQQELEKLQRENEKVLKEKDVLIDVIDRLMQGPK